MSWVLAGPVAVTDVSSLDSPNGSISLAEWNALDLQFDFSCDIDWALSWLYLPNDYAQSGELLRLRMQIGGGQLYFTLDQRDSSYVESNVFAATPGNLATGATGTVRVTRDVNGLVSVYLNEVLINSGTHSASVSPIQGIVHFGNTTSGSTTTISSLTLNSAADTTAPVLSNPTATATSDTTASGSFDTDEAGTYYYLASANASETDTFIEANGQSGSAASPGTVNVSLTGLTASTSYYIHYFMVDASGNRSNVVSSTQITTAAPQLSIDSISVSNPRPTDVVTLNLTNASASGKTLSCSAGSIPVLSQNASSISFECPNPISFGSKTLTFNQNITITLTDGAQTDTIEFSIQPEVGYTYTQIAALMGDGTYLGTSGVEIGDWVYVTGNGDMIPEIASFEMGVGISYTYTIRDATDGVWGTSGTVTFNSADTVPDAYTFTAETNAEVSTQYSSEAEITGVDVGETLTASVFELSNDNGSTWSSSVTFVLGQTRVRATGTSSNLYNTPVSVTGSVNGVSSTFTITTREAVAPNITSHVQNQSSIEGDTVIFSVTATGASSYQWYERISGVDTLLSGEVTNQLSIANSTVSNDNGREFFVLATSSEGGVSRSPVSGYASLTVEFPVTRVVIPGSSETARGDSVATLSLPYNYYQRVAGVLTFIYSGTIAINASGDTFVDDNRNGPVAATRYIGFPSAVDGSESIFEVTVENVI